MLFVLVMMVHALSVSALEDDGYRVLFHDGQGLLSSEGATLDAVVVLGIRQGQSHRLLGQPGGISERILDTRSISVAEREQVARKSNSSSTARSLSWYGMTLLDTQEQDPRSMVGRNRSSDHIPTQVAGKSTSSKGANTAADNMMMLEKDPSGGGSSRSISLAKREC